MTCFIIAEAGVNHNGSLDTALEMVAQAAKARANAVKFQTFHAESLIKPGARKADYQLASTGDGDQLSMVKPLELDEAAHRALLKRCGELGIEFMSTPFDDASVELLLRVGIKRFKIASGELTNLPFLSKIARCNLPTILSTGMSTLDEVRQAVDAFQKARTERSAPHSSMLTLMHCTSNYPAAIADVNLRAIQTLQQTFGLPVGYSDHTAGTLIGPLAVAYGAQVVEKHFTLDRAMPGPDHRASLEPAELSRYVMEIRAAELAAGNGVKEPRPAELPVRAVARRSITAIRRIASGEKIDMQALAYLRPGEGISPARIDEVVGRKAARDIPQWATLTWEDLAS